ncbi:MAG: ATP-binding protein [Filomicrobium sp.]
MGCAGDGQLKTILSWSSGKDSAWALHVLQQDPNIEVIGLVVTINDSVGRVAVHRIDRALVEAQAREVGLPLYTVDIPSPCPNEIYEKRMSEFHSKAKDLGAEAIAYGDLFLEDIRNYRIGILEGSGLQALFPLWGIPTSELATQMIAGGPRARIACVDTRHLDGSFVGRDFDEALLANLPAEADACGENGEFHTFAYAGPMFASPISITTGETATQGDTRYVEIAPSAG